MAYQQYDNYQQPRQQQYYEHVPQQPHRQPTGHNDQYDRQYHGQYDHGHDQGQYEQWDDGYYDQQQGGGRGGGYLQQQQQGAYGDGYGQMRQTPQGRRPPPQQQYEQEQAYDDRMYTQPQGQDPRGRPMGPTGGMRGGTHRGDPRGPINGRPPNIQQGQGGLRPPRSDRAMMSPKSPQKLPQDSPFPTFPTSKAKPRPKPGSMDEAMSLMSLGQQGEQQGRQQASPQRRGRGGLMGPPQNRGPPAGRGGGHGNPDMHRQDSGHFEGNRQGQQPPQGRGYPPPSQRPPPLHLEGTRGPPQQNYNPVSPTQFGPGANLQRAMTMPQNVSGAGQAGELDNRQQWTEPSSVGNHYTPASPTSMPPRPATASGTKQDVRHMDQRPPMPHMPQQQQQQHHHQQQQQQHHEQQRRSHEQGRADIDNLYDDYYGDSASIDRKSKASSIDMPDFDAIPETGNRHRRGFSIEGHLSPIASSPAIQDHDAAPAGAKSGAFYAQAAQTRSQPDLHQQYSQENDIYEMGSNAPTVPPLPNANASRSMPNGLPSGPRGRGPPSRGMTTDATYNGRPSFQDQDGMYNQSPSRPNISASPQQNVDPRYRMQQPPVHRAYSDETTYSEPGPNVMRNGSPMVSTNSIRRPGTAAPMPGHMPSDPGPRRPGTTQPTNPDALPAHPAPVRAGLMSHQQQNQSPTPQAARPPPVRQYNTDSASTTSPVQQQRRPSVKQQHPVTYDELNRLRNALNSNPSDSATGLTLAKKLVEAASVLADEGGTADTRTRNKNREKFIFEAHKIIKKLVAGGSPDAMFYLADCYGQGLLGLQVDTKEAFALYQSAAKAGHPASAYRTAVCCEMGNEEGGGTKRDPLKAVQWYRRAAALGDVPALYKMGMILMKGLLGQPRNLGEAINMLKRAADRADEQNPHALHELALLYEGPSSNERIIPDEQYAHQLFRQAAELGYKFSQFRLGQAYEYGLLGLAVDARSSISWYSRAAAQEEHQSELSISGWYLTGSQGILEQSDTEAYLWARKAACAEPPLPKALFAMGYFTEVGIGCPRSLEEAKRWYGRAAAYKFPKAQERLEELKKGGARAQKSRERLSRTNQKQHDENCSVM